MDNPSKLDKPPTVENWARMQYPSNQETTLSMFRFLKGRPIWSYEGARRAIRYRIEDRIDRKMALKGVANFGSKVGRPYNAEVIEAFFEYEAKNTIEGIPYFSDFSGSFPLSRIARIPVRPLTVVSAPTGPMPIFLCPWSKISLDYYQCQLFMTVVEEAIFTLVGFESSEAKFLFFPKRECKDGKVRRRPVVWHRGDFPLLSKHELEDQVKIFRESSVEAAAMYNDWLASKNDDD